MEEPGKRGKFLATREKDVEFIFRSPNAMKVYLAGEFNYWEAESLPMEKQKEGTWEAAVKLPPGRYEYKLFVDNGWAEEPPCTVMIGGGCFKIILNGGQVPNHFGTRNYFFWVK